MNGIYALQQTFVKFSLLALYHRLFWVNRHFVRSVWLVGIVQGCWGIAILLVHIFLCTPMEKIWTPWMVEGTCVDVNTLFAIYEALNSVLDFIVAGLAIWMLPSLQIRKSTRWHLAGLFVLGAFSGFIGIIKIVEAYDSAQRNFQAVIWNVVQMSISIICCCAPIYRSILPKMGMSSIPSWASWSLRGSSRRSKAVASTADGTSKFSMRSYQGEGKAGGTSVSGNWINLDGSSQRALAWVDAESHGKDQSTYQDIPMGRMKVERSVEVI
ncbi:Sat4 [Stachybotrys chartarum IBT 7711]|uniref:Satratoxin biosynthesis SC1 cluster protein 4 n=1 Tax=Stachybotrys chartarum (strain CBS 109288 / IBT 7711) TaxID=1280523 RepID=SAT4_STACB|nr:RecName: Full=Satratoxin biosynthesis SC1 cluster protein 4 [Stachybotrys chartarum IBT 7711]KEY74371.1 Sat4 [Stachybotrys chartarum IBT 7711]KFA55641.1 Sat4 [Stachybotrys chartarum IBT 40293]